MRTQRIAMAFVTAAASVSVAGALAGEPIYPCRRNPVPPTLDGVVDGDPGWANLPGASGFHRLGGGYAVAKQSTAFATWDDANLYLAVVAEEPDLARIKPIVQDGGDCWGEDSVELFVQPPDRGVFQLGISTAGARCSGAGSLPLSAWAAQAARTADGYSVEVRVSFAGLGATPKPGDVWRLNWCRNIYTTDSGGDKYTTRAPLVSRFLEPEHFAALSFAAGPLAEADCRQAENALNAGYRDTLTAELAALAGTSVEYRLFLTEAAATAKAGPAAGQLAEEWRTVEALARVATLAPLPALRQALQRSADLRRRSYELKYTTLLQGLFE